MSKKRRTFSAEFKAQVGLEALKGIEPVHAIAARHKVHQITAPTTTDGFGTDRRVRNV